MKSCLVQKIQLSSDARDKHNCDWRYGEWRTAVFERDTYTCRVCGKRGGELQAHHIKEWAKHKDLRFCIANGMTVCKGECHREAAKANPTEYE